MDINDDELKKSERLDKLKQKLYSPHEKFGIRRRRELHERQYGLADDWEHDSDPFEEVVPEKKMSVFAKLLAVAVLFFVGAAIYGSYVWFNTKPQVETGDIEIQVIGPVSVGVGETLTYDVVLQNNNELAIESVDLVITYPEGTTEATNLSLPLERDRDFVGDLEPTDTIRRTKTAALFGNENDTKQIEVGIEYRIPGISTIFKKKKVLDIVLQSAPVRISIDAVDEHIVGQELNMDVTVTSNSNKTLQNVQVVVDYPFGFELADDADQPQYGNNVWYIGELDPKSEETIRISGTLQGQNSEERVFKFNVGVQDELDESKLGVTFNSFVHSIEIARPFFAVDIAFDGESNDTVVRDGSSNIQAIVTYTNNLNDPIYDPEVTLKLSGEVLNEASVSTGDGFYDSNTRTIQWNQQTSKDFNVLNPRTSYRTRFSFASENLGTASSLFINPEILFDLHISGTRVSEDNVEETIESDVFRRVRFATRAALQSTSFYGVGPFENEGSVPPRIGQTTGYTIQWDALNTSNNISGARITGVLPSYVTWTGNVYPANADVKFDPATRQVTWIIGTLEAGAGYAKERNVAAFQVNFTPSVSQKGDTPNLITSQVLSGTDSFTGTRISTTPRDTTISAEDLRAMLDASKVVE